MKMTWKSTAFVTIIVGALLLYGTHYTYGLPKEKRTVATLYSYEQETKGNHSAYLEPNLLYEEVIGENETIYTSLAEKIEINLSYAFTCTASGDLTVEYETSSALSNPGEGGWSKAIDQLVTIQETEMVVDNDSAKIEILLTYDVPELLELIDNIQDNIEMMDGTHQITTTVSITTNHETEFGVIGEPIEQEAILNISRSLGTYKGTIGVTIPEVSVSEEEEETLVVKVGSSKPIRLGATFALLAWIPVGAVLTGSRYKADKIDFEKMPEAQRILRTNPVIETEETPDLPVQTVSSMKGLKEIADDYGSRIFHTMKNGKDVFFATDNIVYQYVVREN